MPTGQTIVTEALTILGINNQSGTPGTGDSNDALAMLNAMWDAWSIDEGFIFATTTVSQALTANQASYTISMSRLYRAYFVNAGNRNELKVVTTEEFLSHNDLSATAVAPDECYANFSTPGNPLIFIWPIVRITGASLQLEAAIPFSAWELVTNYAIPPGYQDLIQWALAGRLIPSYGMAIDPATVQLVQQQAAVAEARVRLETSKNRLIPPMQAGFPQSVANPQMELNPPQQK